MKKQKTQDACRQFRSVISELVGRYAAPEVVQESEQHRAGCSDCESEYQLAVRVETSLGALPELSPGDLTSAAIDRMFASQVERIGSAVYDPTAAVDLSLNCDEFRDTLADFVSEELPVGAMLDGVQHASACHPCGSELTAMQSMQDALRSMAEVEPPATIWTSLMARIEAEEAAAPATDAETVEATSPATARTKLLPVLG